MKIIIVGAGRMGMRHALGVLKSDRVTKVLIADIAQTSLDAARNQLLANPNSAKVEYTLFDNIGTEEYDVIIFATTAKNRVLQYLNVIDNKPEWILFEKPLGQSLEEVEQLFEETAKNNIQSSVNLNMRMYDFVKDLKKDLDTLPQLQGQKSINFIGGALGIGANGIHYIDLLIYLFGATRYELHSGEIDDEIIPSGRGPEFGDYGGWAYIKFYNDQNEYLGNSYLSLSANSSAFGGWEIIGKNGRIRINELEGDRVDILRDPNSNMPVNRYAADYLHPVKLAIESPNLGDLTYQWIEGLSNGTNLLPTLSSSYLSHQLLFDWLGLKNNSTNKFLIT